MLNKEKHQLIMGQILRDIYADATIASLLGFKGGTAAYFFYKLPRFSVDLDFDLLNETDQQMILEKITAILQKYGTLKDSYVKRYTVFALLSYGDVDHNVKIEINTRMLVPNISQHYELKKYLGISMLVAKKDYLFSSKLAALTSRNNIAMRDVYDIYFFAKNNWDINGDVLQLRTGQKLKPYLANCITTIKEIKTNQILHGLGELIDEKEKIWVKTHLRDEAVFLLNNYKAVMK